MIRDDLPPIEFGIPVPGPRGKWKVIMIRMNLHDCVTVKNKAEAHRMLVAAQMQGKKIRQKKQKNGKIRVWRIK